jgi:hypothetical protein
MVPLLMDIYELGDYFLLDTLKTFTITSLKERLAISTEHTQGMALISLGIAKQVRHVYERDSIAQTPFLELFQPYFHQLRFDLLQNPEFVKLVYEIPQLSRDLLAGMIKDEDFVAPQYPSKCSGCKRFRTQVNGKIFTSIKLKCGFGRVLCGECEEKADGTAT